MKIGDLLFGMLADDTGFKADVVKKAQDAGDEAGKTMGARLGEGLKTGVKAALVGLGAVVAGGLAIGIKGLMDLDNAMADFRAETGATEEEVKSASDAVLAFSKRNLQPIKEIAGTMAALRTEMGATQEQAEDLTEPFLKFAEVTGQTGPDAVRSFDNILDAWNLTAEDSQGIMDQLIASHQKYGGSVVANQEALADLAPALLAANLTLDDGIGLLNLFASAGLDSAVAVVAFQKALTKVESPEELQALIDDIIATEDPFLRAQKAADLFGAKAGAKLANALRPGMAALDSYHISQEEAVGSAQRAAEAFEGTFGRQAQLWINNIKGMAIGLVRDLGPGLLGTVASFATIASGLPNLQKGLAPVFDLMKKAGANIVPALFRSLGALSDSIPALIVRLKALGMAGGLAVGGIIAIGVAVGSMNAQIIDSQIDLAKRIRALNGDITTIFQQAQKLADETGMSWNEAAEQIVSGMETAAEKSRNAEQMMSQGWAEAWSKVNVVTGEGGRLVAATAEGIPIEVGGALAAGAGTVGAGAKDGFAPIREQMREERIKAAEEAKAIPSEIAAAIIAGRDLVLAAGTGLANAATDPLLQQAKITELREQMKDLAHVTAEELEAATPATIAADKLKYAQMEIELAAYLLRADPKSKEAAQLLAKYAKSEEPATKAAYDALMTAVEDRTFIMANEIEAEAERAGIAPEEAFRRHKAAAEEHARLLAGGARTGMAEELAWDAAPAGNTIGTNWADALIAAINAKYGPVGFAVGKIKDLLGSEPGMPAPSPVAPPTPAPKPAPAPKPVPVYGKLMPTFAQGAWDVPGNMLAGLHRGEMVVPSVIADVLRNQFAGSGNPDVVNNTWVLNVEGVPRTVDSKRAALDELERMGETWG